MPAPAAAHPSADAAHPPRVAAGGQADVGGRRGARSRGERRRRRRVPGRRDGRDQRALPRTNGELVPWRRTVSSSGSRHNSRAGIRSRRCPRSHRPVCSLSRRSRPLELRPRSYGTLPDAFIPGVTVGALLRSRPEAFGLTLDLLAGRRRPRPPHHQPARAEDRPGACRLSRVSEAGPRAHLRRERNPVPREPRDASARRRDAAGLHARFSLRARSPAASRRPRPRRRGRAGAAAAAPDLDRDAARHRAS